MQSQNIDGWRVRLGRKLRRGELESYTADVRAPDGQRIRRNLGTTDEAEARELLAQWVRQVLPTIQARAVAPAPQPDPRLHDLAAWYLDAHCPQRGLAPSTIAKYRHTIETFVVYSRSRHRGRVSQITWEHVEAFVGWLPGATGRPQSAKTRHGTLTTLRSWLNAAHNAGIIDDKPIRRWLMPRVPDSPRQRLERDERDAILDALREHKPGLYPIVAYMAWTGASVSDAIDLRWGQVHLDTRRIERPRAKTRRLASFPISDRVLALLADLPRDSPLVFPGPGARPWKYDTLRKRFSGTLSALGFRHVRLKDLRTTFATLASAEGMPAVLLQRFMNHSDIQTTLTYYQEHSHEEALRWANRVP